jgi:hypothetical protein
MIVDRGHTDAGEPLSLMLSHLIIIRMKCLLICYVKGPLRLKILLQKVQTMLHTVSIIFRGRT